MTLIKKLRKVLYRAKKSKKVLPLNWTVGMVGILSGTVEDALITYAAISGESFSDQSTLLQWFNDCHPDIKLCCSKALDRLQKCYGWQVSFDPSTSSFKLIFLRGLRMTFS
ncbi:hypothetical protein RND81_05G067700 [Saponaria officinalis]|uniref:Uncharacterized protein n=1 Tax=Saponaria officinalis TaxID=3572 RepID=A0AAW1KV93_SAPOF